MQKPTDDTLKNNIGDTSFLVRVKFRQNASWQGEIEWLGKEGEPRRRFFRSMLEMITLMQEALECEGRVKADVQMRSWDDEPDQ